MNIIRYVLLLLSAFFIFFSSDSLGLSNAQFYIYTALFIIDFIYEMRSVSLLQIWLLGIVYIVVSEGLTTCSTDKYLEASKLVYLANDFVILGYYCNANRTRVFNITQYSEDTPTSVLFIYILFTIMYMLTEFPRAIAAFQYGRMNVEYDVNYGFLHSITGAVALPGPAVIAYYYKSNHKPIVHAILWSMPIFVALFMFGSRFPLLFSITGFALTSGIIKLNNLSIKNLMVILISFIILISSADLMKKIRVSGVDAIFKSEILQQDGSLFSQKAAQKMSPEGTIDMTDLSMRYFKSHPHTHGLSITFPLYAWIPRVIWHNKPTMLGHWLVRTERGGFSEGHSTSFGFLGEAYADFGYGCIVMMFLLGYIIKYMEDYKNYIFSIERYSPQIIIASMFYPYVFFIVRSPVTGTVTFIGIYVFYYIIKKSIQKRQTI